MKTKAEKGKQQNLFALLALLAFVVFLAVFFSAGPVYADSRNEYRDPGEGGVLSYTIEGYVKKYATGVGASGVPVYLYLASPPFSYIGMAITESNGHFLFYDSGILAYGTYTVSVNGMYHELGTNALVPSWGQWMGCITTNNIGYGFRYIYLQQAAIVNVPAATLYSNTLYTQQIAYSTGSSHDLSFRATVGSTGFSVSQGWTVGATWTIYGQKTAQWGRRYYGVGYYNDVSGEILSSGLSAPFDPYEQFQSMDVPEYLTPNLSQPNYGLPTDATPTSFVIGGSESVSFLYTETGSFTWSIGYSGSVGVRYLFYTTSINIDVTTTVTDGYANTVTLMVGPLPPGTPHHKFVLYTRGFSFTQPNNNPFDPANKGGPELHIWDTGVIT